MFVWWYLCNLTYLLLTTLIAGPLHGLVLAPRGVMLIAIIAALTALLAFAWNARGLWALLWYGYLLLQANAGCRWSEGPGHDQTV